MKIRIKHKLFFTLLLTSVVVASGMFWYMQWSFDRGFLNYVNKQELAQLEKLDQLEERLANSYAEQGDWQFLTHNEKLWRRLHNEIFSTTRRSEPTPDRDRFGTAPPPPVEMRDIRPRLVLFDAHKQRIVGGPPDVRINLKLKPFSYQDEVIGYMALIPAKALSDEGDLLFLEQQTESFALMAFFMAALSLLLSFPIAFHLLRPIKELTGGTSQLIAGKYKTRIPVTTTDELGKLSEDFNILAVTLEKNENARQQWVADFSHELRTPLAILCSDIEALQDGIRQPNAQNIETLHVEAMHMGRLINDLYELSMSDVGALTYKKVNVDPVGILKGTIELFESRFDQKGLTLTTNISTNLAFSVLADPDRLQQLFSNLLENSLRYTDSPGQLEIKVESTKTHVSFCFQDSAPSVSPTQLPKLFDRLYRGVESRSRASGGAGLGLTICKNIVDAHQGKIAADISSRGGIDIKIELPLRS